MKSKKKSFVLAILFCLLFVDNHNGFTQKLSWSTYLNKEYSNFSGSATIVDSDNNSYTAWSYDSNILLVKYDFSGKVFWSQSVDVSDHADIAKITSLKKNNQEIYLSYESSVFKKKNWLYYKIKINAQDGYMYDYHKYDLDATKLVSKPTIEDIEGSFYSITDALSSEREYVFSKYNQFGMKEYDFPYQNELPHERISNIFVDQSMNAFISGASSLDNIKWVTSISKFDSRGEKEWVIKRDYLEGFESGQSVVVDSEGDIYLVSAGVSHKDSNIFDRYLISKITPEGESLWTFTFYQSKHELSQIICAKMNKKDVIVAANLLDEDKWTVLLTRISSQGEVVWQRKVERDFDIFVDDIFIDDFDNIYLTGYFRRNNKSGIFLEKIFNLGISKLSNIASNDYQLQNYPNPFNATTAIHFSLLKPSQVILKVFNLKGEELETLIHQKLNTGHHQVTWSAQNLPSGTYFYLIETDNSIQKKKMVLVK